MIRRSDNRKIGRFAPHVHRIIHSARNKGWREDTGTNGQVSKLGIVGLTHYGHGISLLRSVLRRHFYREHIQSRIQHLVAVAAHVCERVIRLDGDGNVHDRVSHLHRIIRRCGMKRGVSRAPVGHETLKGSVRRKKTINNNLVRLLS